MLLLLLLLSQLLLLCLVLLLPLQDVALRAAKSVIRSTCDAEAVDALEFKIVGFFLSRYRGSGRV